MSEGIEYKKSSELTKSELIKAYRYHLISKEELYEGMESLDLSRETTDVLIWEPEKPLPEYEPSLSDFFRAYQAGLIDEARLIKFFTSMGLDPDDFWIYEGVHTKDLSRSDIQTLWERGMISEEKVDTWSRKQGLSRIDSERLAHLVKNKRYYHELDRYEDEIIKSWMKGALTWIITHRVLSALGWKKAELDELYYARLYRK